jgi:hypothetical protein
VRELIHLPGLPSFEVEVSPRLPYESTDPERPGVVHVLRFDNGLLLMSQQAFDQLKRRAYWAKARAWFRRTAA